jgi:hypothetical protein
MSFASDLAAIQTDAPTITKILAGAKSFNWDGLLNMWSSEPIQQRVGNGESAVMIILQIAGLFLPPEAVVINDLELADEVVEFLGPVFGAVLTGQAPDANIADLWPSTNWKG